LEDADDRSSFWYAVQTKPRKESSVEAALVQEGLEVLFPRLVHRARCDRRRKRQPRRGRPPKNPLGAPEKVEPLFPGYLFVLLARSDVRSWEVVRANPWVIRVLGTGDEPVPVPDEAIDIIMERSFGSGIVVFENSRPVWRELEAGTRVRITEEPLRDLEGILEKPTSGQRRVRVLLQLMGQQVPVVVDVGSIRPVAEDS
jgi:transcription antitermination factor NusG